MVPILVRSCGLSRMIHVVEQGRLRLLRIGHKVLPGVLKGLLSWATLWCLETTRSYIRLVQGTLCVLVLASTVTLSLCPAYCSIQV